MNKRSAMLVAAGLVLTLIVGGVAVAVGMTGPSSSAAAPRLARHQKPKPIVKTIKKTVKVHKKSPQVAVAMPATTTYSSSGYSGSSSSDTGSGPGYTDHSGSSDPGYTDDGGSSSSGGEPGDDSGSGGSDDSGSGGGDD